jgi:hypothetical protein
MLSPICDCFGTILLSGLYYTSGRHTGYCGLWIATHDCRDSLIFPIHRETVDILVEQDLNHLGSFINEKITKQNRLGNKFPRSEIYIQCMYNSACVCYSPYLALSCPEIHQTLAVRDWNRWQAITDLRRKRKLTVSVRWLGWTFVRAG